jgi:WD40 repeat protein
MRGSQLARFESWAVESGIAQTGLEREYLAASVAAREAERLTEEARRTREAVLERRSIRRLRALVGVLALAALVAAGLTVFAFQESNRSKHETKIATARQLAAASVANLEVDPELSMLLGLRAVDTTGGGRHALPEAVEALHRAVETSRIVRTIRTRATALAFSPDGTRLATAGPTGVRVWRSADGRRLLSLAASPFHAVTFSPEGLRLAAGAGDGSAVVWDVRSGRRLAVLHSPIAGVGVNALAFSPDGTMVAVVDGVGDLWVMQARGRRVLRTIRTGHNLCGVAWTPDGVGLATGDCGTTFERSNARIWNVRAGKAAFTSGIQAGGVDLSRNGRYLGTPNRAGFAEILDVRSGRVVSRFKDHSGEVLAFRFSPDDHLAATSSTDGTARLWETSTGRQLLVLRAHRAAVRDLAFTAGGRLATTSDDGTVRIWDVTTEGSRDWLTLAAHRGGVLSVDYSPDGRKLLTTGTDDGKARFWDARTGRLLRTFKN